MTEAASRRHGKDLFSHQAFWYFNAMRAIVRHSTTGGTMRIGKGVLTAITALMLVAGVWFSGCGGGDGGTPDPPPQIDLPTGTESFKLSYNITSTVYDVEDLLGPNLIRVTLSGTEVSGVIASDVLGGCGTVSGSVDPQTGEMNLTISIAGGRELQFTATWSYTTWMFFTITDGAQIHQGHLDRVSTEAHAASDYGVTFPGSAAVSITNTSAIYSLLLVRLRSAECFDQQYGGIEEGESAVYAVPPGAYHVQVRYSATAGNWLCRGSEYDEMVVEAGGAAVYSLEGGSPCGSTYTRPDLEKQ